MFSKTKKRHLFKRKRGSPVLATDVNEMQAEFDQYKDFTDPRESESSRVFRQAFVEKFMEFKNESDLLVRGVADISDTWKDILGTQGIAAGSAVVAGVIGLLGALMIISGALSAGLAIPIAVVGIGVGIAFYKYREWVKQERLDRATAAMDRDDFMAEVMDMSHQLANLYRLQLESMTVKDANYFADAIMKAISEEMLKNKDFAFDELLYPASLQGVLMRAGTYVPKTHLDMNLMTDSNFNSRGMIRHTAFYLRETGEFYQSGKSKSRKYGVLYFDRKSDLDDYQAILSSTMKKPQQWQFQKMREHEVGVLKRSSIFKAYVNDGDFELQKSMRLMANVNEEEEQGLSVTH